MPDNPNILLVHSDQHRWDCVGVNGHSQVETPHLDGLAAAGCNFTNAYTPTPVCTPARNSLLTGQWSHQHGYLTTFETEVPLPRHGGGESFSSVLAGRGYNMGYVGKWHVDPERTPHDYGFDEYIPNHKIYLEADEQDYPEWRESQGIPPQPHENEWLGEVDPHISPDESRLAWGADHTIELLSDFSAQDEPFFLRWDPTEPHLPNVVPEPYASMYNPETIEPWQNFPDDLQDKPEIQAQQRRTWEVDEMEWSAWAPVVARYLGEISLLDVQIGRILDQLDELGLADDTLVIYTSDHGDMCGGHGMLDKHYVMYDDIVRVPLIARWPGEIEPGTVIDSFVAHSIDLAATFCDVADGTIPNTFQGESLVPLFEDPIGAGRDDIFGTYHGNQNGLYSQRMVRNEDWKYVWNATAQDELYDLRQDPGELENRVTDSACESMLTDLRIRLVEWMERTDDRLLNQWTRNQIENELF